MQQTASLSSWYTKCLAKAPIVYLILQVALTFMLFVAAESALGAVGTALAPKDTPQDFIKKASIGGQFEISSSQLALTNSKNDEVKKFAQKMLEDHTQISNGLQSVSASERLGPKNTEMDSKHRKMLDELKGMHGETFDRQYISNQVTAHKEAVKLFTDYSQEGGNEALKGFASQTLPTLQGHEQHVMEIQNSLIK